MSTNILSIQRQQRTPKDTHVRTGHTYLFAPKVAVCGYLGLWPAIQWLNSNICRPLNLVPEWKAQSSANFYAAQRCVWLI